MHNISDTDFSYQRQHEFRELIAFPDPEDLEGVMQYRVEMACLMVADDCRNHLFPRPIKTLADVDEITDANMYLIDESHPIPRAGSFYEWPELDAMDVAEVWCKIRNRVDSRLPAILVDLRENPGQAKQLDVLSITRAFCR